MKQRVIKFRVWDKKENKYQSIVDLECYFGTLFEENGELKHPKLIFEQFTGLKDRNGKKVYEGDIIKHVDYAMPEQVYFENGAFCNQGGLLIECSDGNNNLYSWEVIGNIHETIKNS